MDAEMFEKTVAFLDGDEMAAEPIVQLQTLMRNWSKDGFSLRRGMNVPSYD
jgi:hypothetical protein